MAAESGSCWRAGALVNKASHFLKDHYCVPPFWRLDENKGMVRALDGQWIQIQPDRRGHLDDDHHHDGHGDEHRNHHGHFPPLRSDIETIKVRGGKRSSVMSNELVVVYMHHPSRRRCESCGGRLRFMERSVEC
jgi:hypothetical protein